MEFRRLKHLMQCRRAVSKENREISLASSGDTGESKVMPL